MNKKYHDIEEDITMTEAQIESIQKRKQVVTTTSTVKMTSGSVKIIFYFRLSKWEMVISERAALAIGIIDLLINKMMASN